MTATAVLAFVGACSVAQIANVSLALSAMTRPAPASGRTDRPAVSIVRPVTGLEHGLERTLTTTFNADYPQFEILFCVASATDPALPLLHRLVAAHPQVAARVLVGDDKVSGNPKLNNCVKGWRAAKYPYVMMIDSNVLLPTDYITRLVKQWTPDTGLVSSPPIGIEPQGFWARLECAFLNSFQARWQLAADRVGNGFAQGKVLFWRKDLLEAAGGIAALGHEMAEDVASTKVVRAAGLRVRLPGRLFAQPIGRRSFAAVWSRQLRWARVRRLGFLGYFLPEIIAGAFFPVLALLVAGVPVWLVLAFVVLWYGCEYLLARVGDWPRSPADIAAWVLRDALIPALWLASWASSSFEWRGNVMTVDQVPVTSEPSGSSASDTSDDQPQRHGA